MKLFISIATFLCLIMFCNSSTNCEPDNSSSYFVDWTVDGKHFYASDSYSLCGIYSKSTSSLAIMGFTFNSDSSVMSMVGSISNLKTTGTYSSISADSPILVSLYWMPTNKDNYGAIDETGANLSITVTSLAGPVTGSFTGKLSKPVSTGGTTKYKYVNIQGTFSVPVF